MSIPRSTASLSSSTVPLVWGWLALAHHRKTFSIICLFLPLQKIPVVFRVALALLKVISLKSHNQPPPTATPILASNEVGAACYTILHYKRLLDKTE